MIETTTNAEKKVHPLDDINISIVTLRDRIETQHKILSEHIQTLYGTQDLNARSPLEDSQDYPGLVGSIRLNLYLSTIAVDGLENTIAALVNP